MCDTCGCDDVHVHHNHDHDHDHDSEGTRTVDVRERVLSLNDQLAKKNAEYFDGSGVLCLNLLSSPGSGKTTLLESLLGRIGDSLKSAVIEGDQQTTFDAARIRKHTDNVTQINTNRGCHLDAHMISHALSDLDLEDLDVLFVENVGNLVCPAMFDLGEHMKVVILSVTEGDDKPLKYPNAFFESDLAIISKIDLLPYVDFDLEQCTDYIGRVNPKMDVLTFSAKTGEGLDSIVEWIDAKLAVPA